MLCNLAEFLQQSKDKRAGLATALLSIALKIRPDALDADFARTLYLLGHLFSKEKLFIRSEGLFAHARQVLGEQEVYERVELSFLFGNMLRQVDIRAKEGEALIERGRELARKMPEWYPYLPNLFVPEMHFN